MVKLNIQTVISRYAAIEEELDSLGATKLLKEQELLKMAIRDHLISQQKEMDAKYNKVISKSPDVSY